MIICMRRFQWQEEKRKRVLLDDIREIKACVRARKEALTVGRLSSKDKKNMCRCGRYKVTQIRRTPLCVHLWEEKTCVGW